MSPDAKADALEALRASYFDANGGPVVHENAGGGLFWGPQGKAESLGLEPEDVAVPMAELRQMEDNAREASRALWQSAVVPPPPFDAIEDAARQLEKAGLLDAAANLRQQLGQQQERGR